MQENNIENIKKAQNGDKDAMADLVQDNQGLIWNIAKRFFGRGYDKEEIYQIGCLGFVKAIRRFDFNYDVKLSTYAVPYILGEIKRFLRDDGPVKVSRSLKELYIKIVELKKEYIREGKELDITEVSNILKIPKEEIIMAVESAKSIESIEDNSYEDKKTNKTLSIADTLSTNKNEEELIIDKLTVQKMINGLKKRDKEIIVLRFYKNKTQAEVARIMGVSQVQISRIEKKILEGMKDQLVS